VTDKAKAAAVKKITFQNLEKFTENLFSSTYVEGMMYGNMTETQAKELSEQLLVTLESTAYPKDKQLTREVVVLPDDKGPFIIDAKAKTQGNVAILAIETLPFNFQYKAAQQNLKQAIRNPIFSTLRTKQQTGYIVFSQGEEVELHLFDIFAVQSNTHDGRDLIARYELFLEGFLQEIGKTELSEQEFETIKTALLEILTQPPKNIREMATILYKVAFKYNADFDWLDKRVEGFKTLCYPKFVELSQDTLGKQNKRRIAILLKGAIPEAGSLQYQKLNTVDQVRKLSHYEGKQPIPVTGSQ
jgi:insulysin